MAAEDDELEPAALPAGRSTRWLPDSLKAKLHGRMAEPGSGWPALRRRRACTAATRVAACHEQPGAPVTMDGVRYKGYVAAREAIVAQPLDPLAAETLEDLAEGLLLARDEVEAEEARAAVPDALAGLVDRHVMTRRTADRFWVHLRACAPSATWPPSWDPSPGSAPRGVLRER